MKLLNETVHLDHYANHDGPIQKMHPIAKSIITMVYILCLVTLKTQDLGILIIYGLIPFIVLSLSSIPFKFLWKRLWLPMIFILGIGIFQPFLYRSEVFRFSGLVFTYGWLSFISITLKSLFMVSMTLLLVMTSGFYVLLSHLRKLKVPKLFILLLMMIYRYLFLLVDEFHKMQQAYFLRSGQKRFHLKDIGNIFGHVLIRSFNRSQDIHYAMMLRGLEDEICLPVEYKITFKDVVIAFLLMALICGIRFIPIVKIGHIVIGG